MMNDECEILVPRSADQQRAESAERWSELLDVIETARRQAIIQGGTNPTEVWMGPLQCRILDIEVNWMEREGRLVHILFDKEKLISGDMEGSEIKGLRVRCAKHNGVYVGRTYPRG